MTLNLTELKESVDRCWAPRRARMREVLEQHLPAELRSDAGLIERLVRAAERLATGVRSGWPAGPLRQQHMRRKFRQIERNGADAIKSVGSALTTLELAISELSLGASTELAERLNEHGVPAEDFERAFNVLRKVVESWPVPEPQKPGNIATLEADFTLGLWATLRAVNLPRRTAARIIAYLMVVIGLRPADADTEKLTGAIDQRLRNAS